MSLKFYVGKAVSVYQSR